MGERRRNIQVARFSRIQGYWRELVSRDWLSSSQIAVQPIVGRLSWPGQSVILRCPDDYVEQAEIGDECKVGSEISGLLPHFPEQLLMPRESRSQGPDDSANPLPTSLSALAEGLSGEPEGECHIAVQHGDRLGPV